ncbi:MAG: hypothetical protein ACXWUG_25065 [Polyangiales bacterium]
MTANRLACVAFTSTLIIAGSMIGCAQDPGDDVGNEEAALKDPLTGKPVCDGKKVLICHIPPGNPANAHEICVGEPAVAAHVKNHGDPIGPCPSSPPPPATDAGTPPPDDTGSPANDGVIIH